VFHYKHFVCCKFPQAGGRRTAGGLRRSTISSRDPMGAGKSISMQARNTYDKILAAVRATTAPLHMRRALVEAEPTTEGSDWSTISPAAAN
jgi:hypothetical protein